MSVMMLTGDKIIFDLDEAARAAYEEILTHGPHATWWAGWEDLPPQEQDMWRRAMAEGLAVYDPETFGRARTELLRLWKIIGPVVRPYLSLLHRPGP